MAQLKETLFIVLIHGFQGGEDTFGDLPKTLQEYLGDLNIVIKPFTFKSQGDLAQCVATFRKWHLEQVNAIEQGQNTNVPTITKTLLICHSMGGIIAADSILSMVDDRDPMHHSILGIIAYDTPYFGLNPPVIHRTLSTHYNTISSAVTTAREWIPQGLFASKSTQVAVANQAPKRSWGLGTIAAVGAGVVAAGAIGYMAKDPVVNHLQFVSVLYKPDELARRMKRLSQLEHIGFVNFFTVVTKEISPQDTGERVFCNLPEDRTKWIRQENGIAGNEVDAHCTMFVKAYNDHYDEMCWQSLQLIREWVGGTGNLVE